MDLPLPSYQFTFGVDEDAFIIKIVTFLYQKSSDYKDPQRASRVADLLFT